VAGQKRHPVGDLARAISLHEFSMAQLNFINPNQDSCAMGENTTLLDKQGPAPAVTDGAKLATANGDGGGAADRVD
jgi:hypothetical protein